jgi:hypothetical protein
MGREQHHDLAARRPDAFVERAAVAEVGPVDVLDADVVPREHGDAVVRGPRVDGDDLDRHVAVLSTQIGQQGREVAPLVATAQDHGDRRRHGR